MKQYYAEYLNAINTENGIIASIIISITPKGILTDGWFIPERISTKNLFKFFEHGEYTLSVHGDIHKYNETEGNLDIIKFQQFDVDRETVALLKRDVDRLIHRKIDTCEFANAAENVLKEYIHDAVEYIPGGIKIF